MPLTAPKHARKPWTIPQAILAGACTVLGVAIAVFGFTDIYLSVTHLLHNWWGDWSWTVILLGEGAALGAYLASLLADLRLAKVPRALGLVLAGYLALFAAGSLTLMLYAGHASAPDLVSHAIVPVSFFGYLLLAKVLVRHLSAPPPSVLDGALADSRRYAMDLLRDRKGVLWRWRPSVPSLLRRQVLTGRLPAVVTAAVRKSLAEYGDPWERAVRAWVLGEEGLNLSARAEADSRKAASEIARDEVPGEPEPVPQTMPETAPGTVPEARPQARPQARSGVALKLSPGKSRGMSPGELAEHVAAMLDEYGTVSQAQVKRDLSVGTEKAKEALRLALKRRMAATG
jgi:hypothetical protein